MFRALDRANTRAAAGFLALSIDARIVVAGTLVIALAVAVFYAVNWRAQAHENAVALAIVKQKLETHIDERKVLDDGLKRELDAIEATLYSDPTVLAEKTPATERKPLKIEDWMLNRDKEYKAAIGGLQRARIEADATMRREIAREIEEALRRQPARP